jgi:hypothetical protein
VDLELSDKVITVVPTRVTLGHTVAVVVVVLVLLVQQVQEQPVVLVVQA